MTAKFGSAKYILASRQFSEGVPAQPRPLLGLADVYVRSAAAKQILEEGGLITLLF